MGRQHRRFSRCFQIAFGATAEQETAVRAVLAEHQKSVQFDMVLFALDKARNRAGRHFIPIVFSDTLMYLGFATPATIYLSTKLHPTLGVPWVFLHELGHSVGWNLLTPKDSSERWAEDFRKWCEAGAGDGPVWDRLADIRET